MNIKKEKKTVYNLELNQKEYDTILACVSMTTFYQLEQECNEELLENLDSNEFGDFFDKLSDLR